MENGKRLLGVLLLIGGIVIAVFGVLYMNSAQYQALDMLSSVTGSRSDPTGIIAIIVGALLGVFGLGLLLVGGSSAKADPRGRATTGEASRLFAEGERRIRNKDYEGAIQTLERVLDIQPIGPMTNYQLATLYSAKENKKKAFTHLSLAIEQGFKDFKAMNSTSRLDFLRSQPEFREFTRNGYKLSSVESSADDDFIAKLERLGKLKTEGLITEEEYAEQKSKLLNPQRTTATPLDDDVDLEPIKRDANLWVPASGHPTDPASSANTIPPDSLALEPVRRRNSAHLTYAVVGLVAVLLVVIGIVSMLKSETKNASIAEPPAPRQTSFRKRMEIPANRMWVDTGIDVTAKRVRIEYESGQWRNHPKGPWSDGRGLGPLDGLMVQRALLSSLVGKTDRGSFPIGNSYDGSAGTGRLYLGINDIAGEFDDNSGSLNVSISVSE